MNLSPSIKFIIQVVLLTVACGLLQLLWNVKAAENMQLQSGEYLLAVFAVSVVVFHLFLISGNARPQIFIVKYLAAMGLKFMWYILVLILFLKFSTGNNRPLIFHFLFYYAVFTVFEIVVLSKEIKKPQS